jgi:hypothetical protein
MVKVAEIIITERRVTEKKKIDVDIRSEDVTINILMEDQKTCRRKRQITTTK